MLKHLFYILQKYKDGWINTLYKEAISMISNHTSYCSYMFHRMPFCSLLINSSKYQLRLRYMFETRHCIDWHKKGIKQNKQSRDSNTFPDHISGCSQNQITFQNVNKEVL